MNIFPTITILTNYYYHGPLIEYRDGKLYYGKRHFRYPKTANGLHDVVSHLEKEYGYFKFDYVDTFICVFNNRTTKIMHVYIYQSSKDKIIAITKHKNYYYHGPLIEYRDGKLFIVTHWDNGTRKLLQ